jgi:alpha-tubulin suppressor-like RCC1 family protein
MVTFGSVHAAGGYTLAVATDGTLWGAGAARAITGGAPSGHFVALRSTVVDVSDADAGFATLGVDGSVTYQGTNRSGMCALGRADLRRRRRPVVIAGEHASAVAVGNHGAVVVDGQLLVWGSNTSGQLGSPPDRRPRKLHAPRLPGSAGRICSVAVGGAATYAVDDQGQVWAAGGNSIGQLGCGDYTDRHHFTQVGAAPIGARVVARGDGAFLIDDTGTVMACGDNLCGRLGVSSSAGAVKRWRTIDIGAPIVAAHLGALSSILVDDTGRLWTSGVAPCGQSTTHLSTFTHVPTDFVAVDAAAGGGYAAAVDADGNLWACGSAPSGATGVGDAVTTAFQRVHVDDHAELAAQLASPGIDFDTARSLALVAS